MMLSGFQSAFRPVRSFLSSALCDFRPRPPFEAPRVTPQMPERPTHSDLFAHPQRQAPVAAAVVEQDPQSSMPANMPATEPYCGAISQRPELGFAARAMQSRSELSDTYSVPQTAFAAATWRPYNVLPQPTSIEPICALSSQVAPTQAIHAASLQPIPTDMINAAPSEFTLIVASMLTSKIASLSHAEIASWFRPLAAASATAHLESAPQGTAPFG